jgi:hypothetical protein
MVMIATAPKSRLIFLLMFIVTDGVSCSHVREKNDYGFGRKEKFIPFFLLRW